MPNEMDTDQFMAGPKRPELDSGDPKTELVNRVRAALMALPGEFQFDHTVGGVAATDLFSLNTFLGAGIELEVVRTLNALRPIWDPDSKWATYRFERSGQAFPDVRLVDQAANSKMPFAMGIELKGWWMLAKEGVPSLRYVVSANACAPHDLVCVVPWYLDSAVSGKPKVAEPWVESAKFAAEWRDYWWTSVRQAKSDSSLKQPSNAKPYPTKIDQVSVHPASDSGGNFGRLPRCRPLLDAFIEKTMGVDILGISTRAWVQFLSLHKDGMASDKSVLEELHKRLIKRDEAVSPDLAEQILHRLNQVSELMP
ncbi:hypothetical protein [Brevibacterium ravenspurgense]|uniref:hypothetical protein n=1 Tax=Brevibacterium ravenspurgense TaxID=479117 RepID=UPI0007809854|nr:hypothetical protein [Brevibacterium ravenspurgense]